MRWRHITFINTTWDRFTAAEEINDLYASGADGLYVTLKEAGFYPEREYSVREGSVRQQHRETSRHRENHSLCPNAGGF